MLRHPALIVALVAVHVSSWVGAGLFVCRTASGALGLDHGRFGCTACESANSCGAEPHGPCEGADAHPDGHDHGSDSSRTGATDRLGPVPCDCEHDALGAALSAAPLRGAAAWDDTALTAPGPAAPAIVPTAPTLDPAQRRSPHAGTGLPPRLRALDTIALRC